MQLQPQYLPIYFGNVCLRFLPVFDIVIHRFLELLPVSKSLETLLDHLGGLYKFHGECGSPEVHPDERVSGSETQEMNGVAQKGGKDVNQTREPACVHTDAY